MEPKGLMNQYQTQLGTSEVGCQYLSVHSTVPTIQQAPHKDHQPFQGNCLHAQIPTAIR